MTHEVTVASGHGWGRVATALLVVGVGLSACASDPHPQVSDDQLACASATEAGRTVGRGELGPAEASEDERVAELLREIATLQFALASLSPDDDAVGDATATVLAATDPADAVDAIVRLSGTCGRREVPLELDGTEHTTAACTQLRAIDRDLAGTDDVAEQTLGRLRFTARYAGSRADDLDADLEEDVVGLLAAVEAGDDDGALTALAAADARCAELRAGG